MFDRLRRLVLWLARVPEAPQPPAGAPESVRVFRAGRNHFRVRLAVWTWTQAITGVGIVISLGFLHQLKEHLQMPEPAPVAETAPAAPEPDAAGEGPAGAGRGFADTVTQAAEAIRQAGEKASQSAEENAGSSPVEKVTTGATRMQSELAGRVAPHVPGWVLPLLIVGEVLGIAVFLGQLPLTFAAVRLDWELRWYIVTDRSLRIRAGIWKLQESTMSFANLQQVEVTQGPLQRLLGLADVRVQSAGGGGGKETHGKEESDSLHTGIFHGVEHAHEIRDLILERLRRFRAAGLGDPDDPADVAAGAASSPSVASDADASDALAAAQALLAEARALRETLSGSASGR